MAFRLEDSQARTVTVRRQSGSQTRHPGVVNLRDILQRFKACWVQQAGVCKFPFDENQ